MTIVKVFERQLAHDGTIQMKTITDEFGQKKRTSVAKVYYMDLTHEEEQRLLTSKLYGLERCDKPVTQLTTQQLEDGKKRKQEVLSSKAI